MNTPLNDALLRAMQDDGIIDPRFAAAHYEHDLHIRATTPESSAAQGAIGVDWSLFPGWLIDHCEGQIINEEGLQIALSDMLAAAPTAQPQDDGVKP